MSENQTAATNQTDAGPVDVKATKDLIKAAIAKITGKQTAIANYDRYYRGDHPFNFSSEKFTTQFADRLRSFRDNLCKTCVRAPADRLEVIGFATDQKSEIYKLSWEAWKRSQMPRITKRIHRDAFKTGDAFVVVWVDDAGAARIYPQDVRNCTVFYDLETGTVEVGAKLWRGNDGFVYLTLYFRDRIEKYITKAKQSGGNIPSTADAFIKRIVPGEAWPLANSIDTCPMFHFGLEGSILDDVIPLNDALNKSIADMLVSSEANSLRQRWASGIAFEINPETGKQIIPFEAAAQWFASNDAEAKFGQFAEGNLKLYMEIANDFRNEIANVAGIPQYYFRLDGGTMPSGEALRKAESRFTALISDAQLDFGETWAQVMKFALAIDGTAIGQDLQFETQWTPADPMSENELVDLAIKKKNVGVSTTVALSEIGYTDDQITKMQKENSDNAAANAANFSKTFNAGPQLG